MPASTNIVSYFSEKRQKYLINRLATLEQQITEVAKSYLDDTQGKQSIAKIKQVIMFILIRNTLGISIDTLIQLISKERTPILFNYIKAKEEFVPSRAWFYSIYNEVTELSNGKIETLSCRLQDNFYLKIGENAIKNYKKVYNSGKVRTTPPFEVFISYFPPSMVFPQLSSYKRGIIMPYFNLRMYQHIYHISSIKELIGLLKTIEFEDNEPIFRLAGRIGFIKAPPGKNMIYKQINQLESMFKDFDKLVNDALVKDKIIDFTIISVDSTSICTDKRDKNKTNGTCSRGSFEGYKCSIAADANSLPLFSVIENANVADINMYRPNMAPVYSLAKHSMQDIWIETADAAYCSTYLMDDIDHLEHVHWIDLNARNSSLLKILKSAGEDLKKLSKKAIKKGLVLEERKEWIEEIKQFSNNLSDPKTLHEKIEFIKKLTFKYAARARYNGLDKIEQKKEKNLRKAVMKARDELRKSNQKYSKQIGLTIAPYGTIEWFLIYHLRGQNEGINGVLKKKGSLLGDQQKTTWIFGKRKIKNRIESTITLIKFCVLIYYNISGNKKHGMKFIYNWDRFNFYFLIFNQR